jgi:hypothetical protein
MVHKAREFMVKVILEQHHLEQMAIGTFQMEMAAAAQLERAMQAAAVAVLTEPLVQLV